MYESVMTIRAATITEHRRQQGSHFQAREARLGHPSVTILLLLVLSTIVNSHRISFLSTKQVSRTHLVMSATTTADVDNWRVLPKPDLNDTTNHRDILINKAAWSDEAFHDSLTLHRSLIECDDSYVAGPIQSALLCLDHALRLYGPESVLCSFNGGKDAVVILHLVRAAFAAHYNQQCYPNTLRIVRPRVVYFDHADEFPEILDFLQETVMEHDLEMIAFEQGSKFQDGLKVLIDNNVAIGSISILLPMAFVLGTRLTDPNALGQQQFAPSSHYMPPFMRVNPILDWTYGHVWHFLRLFQLSYCCLYDQGYTSLGTVKDTLPCPALAVAGQNQTSAIPKYWPAYMLRDWDQERAGRISKIKKSKLSKKAKAVAATANDESDRSTLYSVSSIGHLSTMSLGCVPGEVTQAPGRSGNVPAVGVSASKCSDSDDEFPSCVSYSSDTVTQKTAGILIIGDEILKGFTADTNTRVAATALRDHNVVLKCVVVVSDNLEDIVQEIRRMQTKVDVVITSGGVGATHDDVTMKSVAAALNCEMKLHEEMAQLLRNKMNKNDEENDLSSPVDLTEAQLKMATLPTYSKLRYLSKNPNDWPVLQCKNIFILPGVPEFFSKKIADVADYLACQLERSPAYKVVLQVDENSIVPILNKVVENHPNVSIGSYPFVSHPEYKTVITVEGRLLPMSGRSNSSVFNLGMIDLNQKTEDTDVQMALDELINRLPEGSVLRVDIDDMRLFS